MHLFCWFLQGTNLPSDVLTEVTRAAIRLFEKSESKLSFKAPNGQGIVTTKHEHGMLGHVVGVVFKGSVETDQGSRTFSFIVRDADLKFASQDPTEHTFAMSFDDLIEASLAGNFPPHNYEDEYIN